MNSPYWELRANQEVVFVDEYGTEHRRGDLSYVVPDERTLEVLYRKGRVYTGIRRNAGMENSGQNVGGASLEAIRGALSTEWGNMHDAYGRPITSYDSSDPDAAYRAGYRRAMDIVEAMAAGAGGDLSAQQIATFGGEAGVGEPTTQQAEPVAHDPDDDPRDFPEATNVAPEDDPQAYIEQNVEVPPELPATQDAAPAPDPPGNPN
jgi:hypothetical protein